MERILFTLAICSLLFGGPVWALDSSFATYESTPQHFVLDEFGPWHEQNDEKVAQKMLYEGQRLTNDVNEPFDSSKWKVAKNKTSLFAALLRTEGIIGLPRRRVWSLLGEPSREPLATNKSSVRYKLRTEMKSCVRSRHYRTSLFVELTYRGGKVAHYRFVRSKLGYSSTEVNPFLETHTTDSTVYDATDPSQDLGSADRNTRTADPSKR